MADPPSSPLSPRSPRGSGGSISSQGSTGSHPHGSEGRPHLRSSHPAIASSPLASARLPLRRSHSLDGSPGTALPLRSPDDPRQRRRPSPTQPRSPLANPPSGGARYAGTTLYSCSAAHRAAEGCVVGNGAGWSCLHWLRLCSAAAPVQSWRGVKKTKRQAGGDEWCRSSPLLPPRAPALHPTHLAVELLDIA
eukprot:m.36871 g.36871  ORF g.36871 m.36871 type:complete len:193 (+) comp5803_c0_seq1:209-787(+)